MRKGSEELTRCAPSLPASLPLTRIDFWHESEAPYVLVLKFGAIFDAFAQNTDSLQRAEMLPHEFSSAFYLSRQYIKHSVVVAFFKINRTIYWYCNQVSWVNLVTV